MYPYTNAAVLPENALYDSRESELHAANPNASVLLCVFGKKKEAPANREPRSQTRLEFTPQRKAAIEYVILIVVNQYERMLIQM